MDTALRLLLLAVLLTALGQALAEPRNAAPGFTTLPKGAKVVVMPLDVELYSLANGGALERQPGWTDAAIAYLHTALRADKRLSGLATEDLARDQAKSLSELIGLHDAVARSIAEYQFGSGLPTKKGALDWSLGESVGVLRKVSGADYALFFSIRDSYASTERKLLAIGAILLVGFDVIGAGKQTGYASLVELKTGRIVWFNKLERGSGDLQKQEAATETLDTLLEPFPAVQ